MRIIFTVTNDLTYDQRMARICSSLSDAGYDVLLIGRKLPKSLPLKKTSYSQKRLRCFFQKGPAFYTEYNFRLFVYLLFQKCKLICAIDLDTIVPCLLMSRLKNTKRIYDAHELFCEMKEIVSRPRVYRIWKLIERNTVPAFQLGYTVNGIIADEFRRLYKVHYEVISNMPIPYDLSIPHKQEKYILYQGAVNEGRCFETLIPAMKDVDARLIICGDGNFMEQAKNLCRLLSMEDKIVFTGSIVPDELKSFTINAYLGVTLFDDTGLSNFYSLANRFFDYMNAGVPQVCVDYPVYREIVKDHPFAMLIPDTSSQTITEALNKLLHDQELYDNLQRHCLEARKLLNWKQEEKKLLSFYHKITGPGK